MSQHFQQPKSRISFIILLSPILSLVFLTREVSALSSLPSRRASLALFRPPTANELAAAASAKQAIVWSSHEPTDSFLVIADGSTIALACLLDGFSDAVSPLELSWSVDDVSTGTQRRHTLTAQSGSGSSHQQTFSFDLGPGFAPARGVFRMSDGSVISLAFTTERPDRGALAVACHLRLGGAVVASSARLLLWDERPAKNTLANSQNGAGLPCRRLQHQQNQPKFVALDCELMSPPSPLAAAFLLETAVFVLSSCSSASATSLKLQSNSTDPSAFYAVFFAGHLRLGWTAVNDWNASDLCISADTVLPSGQKLLLRWRLQISTNENGTAASSAAFVPERLTADPAVVNIDLFEDPPLTRALPCPFLCLAASPEDPSCSFNWLHGRNGSHWPEAIKSPDPAMGSLIEPHRLLLLPWKPLGNPGPPPLAGIWTCRSAASLAAPSSSMPEQVFRVRVAARPSLCGNRPPYRSVVFVPPPSSKQVWSARQSLTLNCTVCGLDLTSETSAAATVTQLGLHGSLGGVETTTETYSQSLSGGGVELGLHFTQFRLDDSSTGGSVLVRCHSMDARGRGLVTFSAVEVIPAPSNASCEVDCSDSGQPCRRFRCPLEAGLAAALPSLGVSAVYLFTLQPRGGAPPQQTLSSVSHLVTPETVARLRCTQLLYYSDDSRGLDAGGGRRQTLVAESAATAAVYRAALGEHRYSRLLLAIESEWLELPTGSRKPFSLKDGSTHSAIESRSHSDKLSSGSKSSGWSNAVDIVLIITMVLCSCVAIFLVVAHSYRYKLCDHIRGWMRKFSDRRMDRKGSEGDNVNDTRSKSKELKKQKHESKSKSNDVTPTPTPAAQQPVATAQVEHVDEQESTTDNPSEEAGKPNEIVVQTSHNAASSSVHQAIMFQMPRVQKPLAQIVYSPQPRQQVMGLLSSSSTSATPTTSTATATQTIKQSVEIWNSDSSYVDFNGSFVSLGCKGSPAVMSWPLPEDSEVSRVDAKIMSTSELELKREGPEFVPKSCYRFCEPAGAATSSARVCDRQLTSNDAVDMVLGVGVAAETSSAVVTSAGPASGAERRRSAMRIGVRDRPEFFANVGAADPVDDAAESDEACNAADHLLSFIPTPPAAEKVEPTQSNAGALAADLARLSRCLVCQPPRIRPVPSSVIGVEISLIGSTTASGSHSTSNNGNSSSCSCSDRSSTDTVEIRCAAPATSSEEIDVPSSEPVPALMSTSGTRGLLGNMLFATTSTAVVEVVESTLAHAGSPPNQQENVSEDICSTCTCSDTGCSLETDETSEQNAPLRVGSSTTEQTNSNVAPQQMQLVLQAVNSAIERLNWE